MCIKYFNLYCHVALQKSWTTYNVGKFSTLSQHLLLSLSSILLNWWLEMIFHSHLTCISLIAIETEVLFILLLAMCMLSSCLFTFFAHRLPFFYASSYWFVRMTFCLFIPGLLSHMWQIPFWTIYFPTALTEYFTYWSKVEPLPFIKCIKFLCIHKSVSGLCVVFHWSLYSFLLCQTF